MEALFNLRGVRYRNIIEVDSLDIYGGITCILGRSGSGKTTLLKLLNCMLTVDRGSISYRGEDLSGIDPVSLRRRVVMLPQAPVIFDGTVYDNMVCGFRLTERDEPGRSSVRRMMEMLSLDVETESDAGKLSGGEKQRLCLGRVLLLEPECLLLDEPSSSLDTDTENMVISAVTQYSNKRGIPVVMVTHSQAMAEDFGHSIVVIEGGRMAGGGNTDE